MTFEFLVSVELEREQGKFISREELSDAIEEAISSADPSSVEVEESTYNVSSWDVSNVNGFDLVPKGSWIAKTRLKEKPRSENDPPPETTEVTNK